MRLIAILAGLATVANAAIHQLAASEFTIQKPPLLPDVDPFYKPPNGFERFQPGDIIRWRPVPSPVTLDNTYAIRMSKTMQILYRTQNSVGEPIATVMTVLIPYRAKYDHVMGFGYFSDAAYSACNPSINLQVGARNDSTFTQAQIPIAIAGLTEGWVVTIADDEGPQAAFGSGLLAGYTTLDSLRAISQSEKITGVKKDPTITYYGYSGGGYSAAWAAELQPTYAPELKIAGIAFGGLMPNITAAFHFFNKNYRAAFVPVALVGIAKDYKNFSDWLYTSLAPEHEAEFKKAQTQCFDGNQMFAYKDIGQYFKRGWKSIFEPIPASVLESCGSLGTRGAPSVPMYFHETIYDDVSPIKEMDDLVAKWCSQGAKIQYERNDFLNITHADEVFVGITGAFTWMKYRHEGKKPDEGCNWTSFSKESRDGWMELALLTKVMDSVYAWLGLPISGPTADAAKGKDAKASKDSSNSLSSLASLMGGTPVAPKASAPAASASASSDSLGALLGLLGSFSGASSPAPAAATPKSTAPKSPASGSPDLSALLGLLGSLSGATSSTPAAAPAASAPKAQASPDLGALLGLLGSLSGGAASTPAAPKAGSPAAAAPKAAGPADPSNSLMELLAMMTGGGKNGGTATGGLNADSLSALAKMMGAPAQKRTVRGRRVPVPPKKPFPRY